VLVELGVVEQRHKAVLEVLEGGLPIVEVARRYGVARQTVHGWLRRYGGSGIVGLADRSSKPATCPHQMAPAVEVRVLELRRDHPGWGPRTIRYQLAGEGVDPVPGRSSIYRALVRHGLVDPQRRRRRRSDYRRWERARPMELWQMDITGGVRLVDGKASVVTGIDDNSRFCVIARVVRRATAKPVCDALTEGMRRHGLPEEVLTDNGKVFTGRFGPGSGEVLFDRICRENGIGHRLTAPRSPTTTGKVERFHKTLKAECLAGLVFASVEDAQAAIDAWVEHYNTARPHQGIGGVPPLERFRLAARSEVEAADAHDDARASRGDAVVAVSGLRGVTRWVDQAGKISLGGFRYHVGPFLAGELVEVICRQGLVEISHRGVLMATHAQRRPAGVEPRRAPAARRRRAATVGNPVIRQADGSGNISFAGSSYRAGRAYARRSVEVAIVAGSVQLSVDGKVVRVHPARHDPAKEHGAFATPKGRPRKPHTVA
jgi:transposase InsO family protein